MSQAFICDRCGDVFRIDDRQAFRKSPLYKRNIYVVYGEIGVYSEQPDLCPICILKLNAWMKKYKDGKRHVLLNDFYEVIEDISGLPMFPEISYDLATKFDNIEACGTHPPVIQLDDGIPRGPKCVEDFVDCLEPEEAFNIFKAIAREMNFSFFGAVRDLAGEAK